MPDAGGAVVVAVRAVWTGRVGIDRSRQGRRLRDRGTSEVCLGQIRVLKGKFPADLHALKIGSGQVREFEYLESADAGTVQAGLTQVRVTERDAAVNVGSV